MFYVYIVYIRNFLYQVRHFVTTCNITARGRNHAPQLTLCTSTDVLAKLPLTTLAKRVVFNLQVAIHRQVVSQLHFTSHHAF